MKKIIEKRGGGKTRKLIMLASTMKDNLIVCRDGREVSNIINIASKGLHVQINKPISYQDFLDGAYQHYGRQILIDNVEDLLQKFCYRDCEVFAFTVTEVEELEEVVTFEVKNK